jgi:tetratricopeptide (TPR) repeat protein
MKKTLNYIILLLLIISCYGFIRIFNSYNQQLSILSDLNEDSWERPIEFIESMEVDFPNLTATALPLKAAQAQYYLYNDSVVKGMALIDEVIAEKSNPFIMLPEALKAKYYNTLGQKDSAFYYSRKAFNGLPRNPFHLAELIRSLNTDQKKDSIDEYFKQIKYPWQRQVWRIYLAATLGDDLDNEFAKQTAFEAIELTQNSNEKTDLLRITAFIKIYGKDVFEKALEIESRANSYFFQDNFEEAKILYEDLLELIPLNFLYKENLGVCLFNLKDFAGSVKLFEEIESEGHILDESQIFVLGVSLHNINRISDACNRLFESQRLGFKEATNAIRILCNSITE